MKFVEELKMECKEEGTIVAASDKTKKMIKMKKENYIKCGEKFLNTGNDYMRVAKPNFDTIDRKANNLLKKSGREAN